MLNIFNGKKTLPEYKLKPPANGKLESLTATKDVGILSIRTPQTES